MKKLIFILSGTLLLAGCKKETEDTPEGAAQKAIAELTAATKALEDIIKELPLLVSKYPSPPPHHHPSIGYYESAIAAVNTAIAKEGVSEDTRTTGKEAMEKANQAITKANQAITEDQIQWKVKYLIGDTKNIESHTATLKGARTAADIEEAIRQIRAFEDILKRTIEDITNTINEAGVSEEIKDKANQAITNANQAIANANQAIEAVLVPQAP